MFKKAKKIISPLILPAIYLTIPAVVLAADTKIVPEDTLGKVTDIVAIIRAIIQFILIVAFVAAFIMLLIGGIRWITAGGDEKGVASARNMITAALIGLVVVLVSYAIILLVERFFGIKIISEGISIPCVNPPCTTP
jgi:hypothetical protein